MSRLLRKRLPPLKENSEDKIKKRKPGNVLSTDSNQNSRVVISKQSTKVKNTRSSKKIQEQDENIVPQNKKSQETEKTKTSNRLLSLKILKQDTDNKKAVLNVKSPVFRDRTNESSDPPVIVPLAKQKSSNTKLETVVLPVDKELTARAKLRSEKVENLQEHTKSTDKSNLEEKQLSQQNLEQKETEATTKGGLRTRSGKLLVGKDNASDTEEKKKKSDNEDVKDKEEDKEDVSKEKDVVPKKKKFFTLSIKDRTRKRKIVKKPPLDESSFSLPVVPEEITPSKKKTLRPRQDVKNYCEKSKLVLSPRSRNSMVVIEKISSTSEKKVPIWKTIQFSETKTKDKDVYEISDSDLSFEENPKKRKKGIKKKPPKRLKKTVKFFKSNKNKSPKSVVKKSADPTLKVQCTLDSAPQVEIEPNSHELPQIHQKPKLVSIEVVEPKNKVSFVPQAAKEFRPFRVTQNFRAMSMMQPNMADHSLLSKTMSPIARVAENVDFSTPWRLPQTGNFSRVCSLVQSTPQIKPAGLLARRTVLVKPEEEKITNDKSTSAVDNLTPVNLNTDESRLPEIPHVPSPVGASIQNSISDDVEDKENAAPNCHSPQKSPKKKGTLATPVFEPQPGPSGLQKQPLRELKILRQTNLNNFLSLDDAPERTEIRTPHGIFDDVHSTPINGKFLKKSSQTDIENAFGFDDDFDASSIVCQNEKPIVLKGILREKKGNVRPRQESESKRPVRFSAKEVLRTLHARRVKKDENNDENKKQINQEKDKREEEFVEESVKETSKKDEENEIIDFSDTFDLLKEQTNEKDDNKQDCSVVPLFVDIEPPTRFATPAKSTYKRKRHTMCSTFSEESDEDDENRNELKEKVKKQTKKSKKENKKLNEWAKGINKTFEEIDNFDLIVE
ncbi:titin-like [Leptopilina boulardi]|uniref:titin-like n=1 Tax=Leptopilina boulardi TaxID=63433 RepID=UPI0021F66BC7|nr:titin-like [Leptopilina boulardi]XP_051170509.1 titin-like [Leptopilina boulardi]